MDYLLLALALPLLLAHASWWLFRKYFPSVKIVEAVHVALPGWWQKATAYFTSPARPSSSESAFVTQQPTVLGGIATLLWPFVLFLNVLLLAQVLAVFFDGGVIVVIPYFGSYRAFSLLMAVLFAVSQSLGGILSEHQHRRGSRWLLGGFVVVAIFAEAALAYYRAMILGEGAVELAPTVWDSIISSSGPVLAGGIAAFVAVTEVFLAKEAFPRFVEPLVVGVGLWVVRFVRRLARAIFGVFLLLGCVYVWLVFGFQSGEQSRFGGVINRLRTEFKTFTRESSRLRRRIGFVSLFPTQRSVLEDASRFPDLDAADRKGVELENDWQAREESLRNQMDPLRRNPDKAAAREKWAILLRDYRSNNNTLRINITEIEGGVVDTVADLKSARRKLTRAAKRRQRLETKIRAFREVIGRLEAQQKAIKDLTEDLHDVLNDLPRRNPVLAPEQVDELRETRSLARTAGDNPKRQGAQATVEDVARVIHEVRAAGHGKGILDDLRSACDALEGELSFLNDTLTTKGPEQCKAVLRRAQMLLKRLREKKKELRERAGALGKDLLILEAALRDTPWWLKLLRRIFGGRSRKSQTASGAVQQQSGNDSTGVNLPAPTSTGSSAVDQTPAETSHP